MLLILAFASLGSPVHDNWEAKQTAAKLEARYRTPRVMRATFLERYTENGHTVRTEAGTAYFRRPGKMRWEYDSPEKNLFLVDGKTAWFYVPADHTVSRVPAKQSADWRTPIALLTGEMKLSRLCSSIDVAKQKEPEHPEDVLLACELRTPKKPGTTSNNAQEHLISGEKEEEVFLEINQETGDLIRVLVQENAGVALEFKFANWQFDPPVPDSLFRFEVPRGVAIVNGETYLGGESPQ